MIEKASNVLGDNKNYTNNIGIKKTRLLTKSRSWKNKRNKKLQGTSMLKKILGDNAKKINKIRFYFVKKTRKKKKNEVGWKSNEVDHKEIDASKVTDSDR